MARNEKTAPVSVVTGCYFHTRDGETLLDFQKDGRAVVKLVGYAVVPLEHYDRLFLRRPGEIGL